MTIVKIDCMRRYRAPKLFMKFILGTHKDLNNDYDHKPYYKDHEQSLMRQSYWVEKCKFV